MSTRGCVAVGTLKKWRGVYNHCDSYPTGLGQELYEHVERQLLEGKTMADIGDAILKFDDWRNYLNGGICEYCGKMAGQPHTISGAIFGKKLPEGQYPDPKAKHHRHNDISTPEEIAKSQITSDDPDPLFIEWVYIIDAKANAIHVLKHESCPMVKLKRPLETNPDGTTKEYARKLSGGRFHFGHCVYKHVHVGTLTMDKKPDWDAIQCGELFEHCSHYAYYHFPELQGTHSAFLGTTEYLSMEPITQFDYAVAYIIDGKLYWKGGSGFSGGEFAARMGHYGTREGYWYQTLKESPDAKVQIEGTAVARTVRDERVPVPGVVWVFPPTLHFDWTTYPKMEAAQFEKYHSKLVQAKAAR